MKKIHIFKTGTHTDSNGVSVSFTETDLQNSINAYNGQNEHWQTNLGRHAHL